MPFHQALTEHETIAQSSTRARANATVRRSRFAVK